MDYLVSILVGVVIGFVLRELLVRWQQRRWLHGVPIRQTELHIVERLTEVGLRLDGCTLTGSAGSVSFDRGLVVTDVVAGNDLVIVRVSEVKSHGPNSSGQWPKEDLILRHDGSIIHRLLHSCYTDGKPYLSQFLEIAADGTLHVMVATWIKKGDDDRRGMVYKEERVALDQLPSFYASSAPESGSA